MLAVYGGMELREPIEFILVAELTCFSVLSLYGVWLLWMDKYE